MSSERSNRAGCRPSALFACSLIWALLAGCGGASGGEDAGDAGAHLSDAMEDFQDASDASPSDEEDGGHGGGDAAEVSEPSGTSCEDVIQLTGAQGSAALRHDVEETGAFAGSCGGEGPEKLFVFTLTERSLFSFDLSGESIDGVLFLRSECGDVDSEIGCDDGLNSDHLSGELDAGTYYLFADTYASVAQGARTLTWRIERHPCLDVQCGEGAICSLSEDDGAAQCSCEKDFVYDGRQCVADPCAADPCAEDQSKECVYVVDDLPAHACVPRSWTLLVYLSADNDLFGGAHSNLEEMRQASLKASSTNTVTLVVLIDGPGQSDTRLLRIRRGEITVLNPFETFFAGRDELDMADGATLRDFGVWAIDAYPAEHYGLILWDHGSGWRDQRWTTEASTLVTGGVERLELGSVEAMTSDISRANAEHSIRNFADARLDVMSGKCAETLSAKERQMRALGDPSPLMKLMKRATSSPLESGSTVAGSPAERGLGGQAQARGFSNDFTDNQEDRSEEISVSSGEYAWALDAMTNASGQKFDLIAFDACQMGLYEVAHASAPYADYFVASEDRIPAKGFPYLEFFSYLYEDDARPVLEWARLLVDAYVASSSAHYTLSTVTLSTISELDDAIDALAAALIADIEENDRLQAIAELRDQTLGFYTTSHRDLGDFARRLTNSETISQEVRSAAATLYEQIGRCIPHKAAQESHAQATGLAIYFPASETLVDEAYLAESALWNQATRWSAFLTKFVRIDAETPASD